VNAGQFISGAGHLGLIGWALAGNLFAPDTPPFEVTEVTAISAEEYAALTQSDTVPEAIADVAILDAPDPGGPAPDLSSRADAAPERARPGEADASAPDTAPETLPEAPPPPRAVDVPGAAPQAPAAPPEESAALLPDADPQPRAAPRVRPDPVAPPEPDTLTEETSRDERAPDPEADAPAEPSEAAAPEAATTEIVTEAEKAAAAPERSLRPRARPGAPADAHEEPAPEAEPPDDAAVDAAIAEALGGDATDPAPAPAGPPLSRGEREALRVAVGRCWNVGSLSTDALGTTVVVGLEMSRDGTPVRSSIRMVGATGGSGEASRQAFEAARRAIIRCGARGFDLPPEKYDRWRDIEMTFNPENMRTK